MFSALPPTPSHHFALSNSYQFSPAVPSPLSSSPLRSSPTPSPLIPRDANSSPIKQYHPEDKLMTSPTPTPRFNMAQRHSDSRILIPSPPPSRGKDSSFAKRATKPNPLLRKDSDARETRRKLFLRNVRDSREDKKWQDRKGRDEMMRVLWVGEERERARRLEGGMKSGEVAIEDEMDFPVEQSVDAEQLMAEEIAMIEAAELEARLEEMIPERQELIQWGTGSEQSSAMDMETPYGSDDDEYDDIFMDVVKEEVRVSSQQYQHQPQEPPGYLQDQGHEMMDMS